MNLFVERQEIVFVEDDDQLREANSQTLELAGMQVLPFAGAEPAAAHLTPDFEGVVVSDIRMPRMDGLELFSRILEIDPEIPVILITGHADVATAVSALRKGAFDFLTKPFAADHLVGTVRKALEVRRLVIENRRLRAALVDESGDSPLIGDSAVMVQLRETISQLALADIDVLVEGETGSGKELVATMLHRQGPRRSRPFIALNCGALPEEAAEAELFGHDIGATSQVRGSRVGRIESSSHGTLFLDEVDSMSPSVQTRFLRVLEEREVLPLGADRPRQVDLRVVAAAKRDLLEAVSAGEFRSDLYYRLNVVRLRIPPLRERREDVPQLFAHFVAGALSQVGKSSFRMSDSIRRHLVDHDWPGNVRELRNFAFTAVLGLFRKNDGGQATDPGIPLPQRIERFEASIIQEALEATGGSIRDTIERLKVPRKTLYDKLARYGIDPNRYRKG